MPHHVSGRSDVTYAIAALDLPLRDEQQMLRDSVQRYLADNARPDWRGLV
jgi:hypothetical protein